jgi:hypothetical protein
MGKKCIPGVICFENMTLFILVIILVVVIYLYYKTFLKHSENVTNQEYQRPYILIPTPSNTTIFTSGASALNTIDTRNSPIENVYSPPVKDGTYFRRDSGDPRGLPINVQTRSVNDSYQQLGILTRKSSELILPLMGRQLTTGNYKWQYYTMTTTGNMNTKLPISMNGKSCTSEYGCDSLSNGDTVYVEGYSDTFRVTLYENATFNYIPFV